MTSKSLCMSFKGLFLCLSIVTRYYYFIFIYYDFKYLIIFIVVSPHELISHFIGELKHRHKYNTNKVQKEKEKSYEIQANSYNAVCLLYHEF